MSLDEPTLAALIADHAARGAALEVVGSATRHSFGPGVRPEAQVSTAALSGVITYEPEELILITRAGTPMAQITDLLTQQNQMLAFEPPDYGALLGSAPGGGTAAGVVATNLAGPRRISHGAARDHTLGFRAVNGRGEVFKSGSRVMKNVTGYDLPKLFAGSWGTLGVMTEVTLKVLPRPEDVATLLLLGLSDEAAIAGLCAGMGSAHEVSGAAYLPAATAAAMPVLAGMGHSVAALRLEGPTPSVAARLTALREELGDRAVCHHLGTADSLTLWADIRDAGPLARQPELLVWKLSVTPSEGPATLARIGDHVLSWFDWSGGLIWVGLAPGEADGGAARVRAAIAPGGGHATLVRAPLDLRTRVPVFPPRQPAVTLLEARIKAGFDPAGILNPGRR
ncbi:MAG: FAD-binding protein [Alphaproteobacteria bacterium]|nr:FAD-binding protein [Alphaproteobacteria bacterium]